MHKLILVCRRKGCKAYVDWRCAKGATKKRKNRRMRLGDGCAGKACTKHYNAAAFARQQAKYASEVASGERIEVEWPDTWECKGKMEYWRKREE